MTNGWGINKEALRGAINRYDIKVEANSSTMDDIESRREEALALTNVASNFANAGVPVNFDELWKSTLDTFEMKNPERFLKAQAPEVPEAAPQEGGIPKVSIPDDLGKSPLDELAQRTGEVARGKIQT